MVTMTATAMRLPTTTGMIYLEYHLRGHKSRYSEVTVG